MSVAGRFIRILTKFPRTAVYCSWNQRNSNNNCLIHRHLVFSYSRNLHIANYEHQQERKGTYSPHKVNFMLGWVLGYFGIKNGEEEGTDESHIIRLIKLAKLSQQVTEIIS